MSKSESIKEKIAKYREVFKALIWLMIAIVSGNVTVAYQILIHKIPAYMIFFAGIGMVVLFLLLLNTLKVWNKLEELEKELENA